MAIIASGASIGSGAAATVAEATASLRIIRVAICNRDTVTHSYHVQFGTHYVKRSLSIPTLQDRIVGPHGVGSGESVTVTKVEADTTTATDVRFTGES